MKGIQGCANRYIDEETLLRAIEVLRKNKEKLQEKWNNFSEEQKLEKYHAAQLKGMLSSDQEVFKGRKMCQVLEKITLGEDGGITVKFLEGTEVNL